MTPRHMMPSAPVRNPVVKNENGRAMADSRDVAAYFMKRHDNVLRDIKNLNCSEGFRLLNFEGFKISDLTGEITSHVMMTKDGFSFLAMGFTGEKAGAFKEEYIARFNAMDAALQDRGRGVTAEDLLANPRQLLVIAQGYALQIEDMKRDMVAMQSDVDALDRIAGSDGLFGTRVTAKLLQMPERKFVFWIQQIRWAYRMNGNKHLLCYSDKHRAGYCTNKAEPYTKSDGSEGVRETLKFTPKGVTRLAKMLGVTLSPEDIETEQREAA
ncbi:phage regulatory protein/antirepressor Ant [Castellaniella sp.]|uniref:Rha family transcriptional regulator n=1 Tax=Castellaniella sp. TaxID=1955812 RepID=UPI002AFE520D|nr:phage regulatory protein/antirepressor Ant [Castellaniella sp.]